MLTISVIAQPSTVVRTGRFNTRARTIVEKSEIATADTIRELYKKYGELEGTVRMLGFQECQGDLILTITGSSVNLSGSFSKYPGTNTHKAEELLLEITRRAHALTTNFRDCKIRLKIAHSQTLSYI